ncbi:HAD family hydrolase [Kribbella pratensis]|uniref:Phosphoglycolate phosphatase n=1 Tax=Kribbella pratensis TaxID=2512112 RepID=A0A4R8C431_9ACTN|nr:HAD family phosphatase [Kribbella pratensis]TDW70592.1 phosphoglycolate phosphatase [Kribbella pratensis]
MTGESPASVFRRTQAVLLDFDGPVCSVFAGYPATQIAQELKALIQDALGHLPRPIAEANGPHEVLTATASFGDDLWRRVEQALQAAEIKAVESATATPGADAFLSACGASDRHVAIVSNNCEASVRTYLDHADLASRIQHIQARDPLHVDRMKPSPFLLEQAARALAVSPPQAVLIGDQVSDIKAALAARCGSIGYANKPGKSDDLAAAGADSIVEDMNLLAIAVSDLA